MTVKSDRLSALLALYATLRDESLKSIEWRLTLFSAGFGAIVAVAAGAVAVQINTTGSRVVLFALCYIIPLICIFVLINWMGEASRCQRVSYFLAAEVEPKINGHINGLKNVEKIEPIGTLSYRKATAFSIKIAAAVLASSLASSFVFCWAAFTL